MYDQNTVDLKDFWNFEIALNYREYLITKKCRKEPLMIGLDKQNY